MDSYPMDYASDYEGSCGRSHHGHHSHVRNHHHHHHHRGRSPSSATGRSTPGSESSNEQAKTRMRWILSLGLLLPALAAIIGVVAWAVSAEVVMGARRESAFKLSSGPSRFHSNGHHDEFGVDRLDLKPGEAKSRISSASSSSTASSAASPSSSSISTSHLNGMSKESRISESKSDDLSQLSHLKSSLKADNQDTNRNANVYFLAGLESLNSEVRPSFTGYRSSDHNNNNNNANSNNKKSAGARVAEVIDRLVQQRKSEGSSPHIVVVAPLSDKSKKSSASIQTTTVKPTTTTAASLILTRNRFNDEPGAFSRDADTLLAAAHLLARHSIASKRSDDEKELFSIETSSTDVKPGFESANLIAAVQPTENTDGDTNDRSKEANIATVNDANIVHPDNNGNSYHFAHNTNQQQLIAHPHAHGTYDRSINGQVTHHNNGHMMMTSASQQQPTYFVSNRMGHGPMPGPFRSGPSQPTHHNHQPMGQQQQHQQIHHQQMMTSQQNPSFISSFNHQQFQGFNGDQQAAHSSHPPPPSPPHQYLRHPHGHLKGGPPQGGQGLGSQQVNNQAFPMIHPGQQQQQQPQQQLDGQRDFQLTSESFPRPTGAFINNRDSYVAQESAPILDFHASQVPAEESGGYQESSPAKGLTLHFGGGPMGGGGQVMTSPLGIFKTLLLPLLPKPRVNLNGKVVFGVVLEKGVGYGKQKKHHPPPPHPPPPHAFHHFGRRR